MNNVLKTLQTVENNLNYIYDNGNSILLRMVSSKRGTNVYRKAVEILSKIEQLKNEVESTKSLFEKSKTKERAYNGFLIFCNKYSYMALNQLKKLEELEKGDSE
nr:MAG TPA: hypothetical protein [Caudoviricetes sp.]DAP80853.1 MAG TPA: hypothetical protein [Caudoviricetes sp.]